MKKLVILLSPLVILLSFTASHKELTEKGYILQLADTSQAVRDEAAKVLLNLARTGKTTLGEGHISEHDSAYWYALIAKTEMRKEEHDVAIALGIDKNEQEIGMCFGQGCFNTYRLDNSFVLQLYFNSNKPNTVYFDTLIWQPRRVYVDAPSRFTGEWRTYYVNGQLSHRVQYSNGVYNGTFISYHANGQVAYQQHYVNGTTQGEDRGYYYSGKVMYVGNYTNGKQNGEWLHYWENGNVKTKMNFVNGEEDGVEQQFYEDGKLYTESKYENGKQTWHRAFDKKGNCTFDSRNVK